MTQKERYKLYKEAIENSIVTKKKGFKVEMWKNAVVVLKPYNNYAQTFGLFTLTDHILIKSNKHSENKQPKRH